MKHLFTIAVISALMAMPAIAEHTVELKDVRTRAVTAPYVIEKELENIRKGSKAPRTRTDEGEQQWVSLGYGTYRDDVFTALDYPSATWNVEIMESASTPGCYKVVNPFGSPECPYFGGKGFNCADLVIHAENPNMVYMEYVELKGLGIQDTDENGNLITYTTYLTDVGGYYLELYSQWGYGPEELASIGVPFGTLKHGNVRFDVGCVFLDLPEIEYQIGANESGLFKITLPGAPDYDLQVTADNYCLEDGLMRATYVTGKDVAAVKYLVVPGFKKDVTSDMREALISDVNENGIEAKDAEMTGELTYGVHSLIAVAYNAEGEVVDSQIKVFYGRNDDAANWKSIGKCEYNENFLKYTYMNMDCDPYEVDIQESAKTPGLYKLVNPYGDVYPKYQYFKDNGYVMDHSGDHYLIVDASNPERVMIEASPIGIDGGDGEVQLFSVSWYLIQNGGDPEDEEIGLDYGKLADGVITFPGGAIVSYEEGYGMTRGNLEHEFYIKLPDANGVDAMGAESEAEYFTISGLKVERPTDAGVYIRRCGSTTAKIVKK